MTNPIMNLLGNQNVQQSKEGLPTSLDDPRMDSVKQYVNEHGGNPKQVFYQLCKQKMLNPANIINSVFGGR